MRWAMSLSAPSKRAHVALLYTSSAGHDESCPLPLTCTWAYSNQLSGITDMRGPVDTITPMCSRPVIGRKYPMVIYANLESYFCYTD